MGSPSQLIPLKDPVKSRVRAVAQMRKQMSDQAL